MAGIHNASFFEAGCDIIPLCQQLDANSTDLQGDWVKLTNYNRAMILLAKYGSEQVDTLALQILQATSSAGANVKALTASRYWTKFGAFTGDTVWTAGVLSTPNDKLGFGSSLPTGAARVMADAGTTAFMLAVDLQAADLDVEPSDQTPFNWISISMDHTQVNNSVLFSAWLILTGGRFPQVTPLSAIS